jgi:thioredoxin
MIIFLKKYFSFSRLLNFVIYGIAVFVLVQRAPSIFKMYQTQGTRVLERISNMEVLNLETFKEKVFNFETSKEWKFNGSKPAIIDFYADWCGPCRMLGPILEEISEQYNGLVDIYKVDTEASPELSVLFGIRSIPSLLFIPLNAEPAMNSGVIPVEGFQQAIKELFDISKPE